MAEIRFKFRFSESRAIEKRTILRTEQRTTPPFSDPTYQEDLARDEEIEANEAGKN